MTAIWTHKWTNSLADEKILEMALTEWEIILDKFTIEQITLAISACKDTLSFPPSIAEFKKAALQIPLREKALTLYTAKSEDPFTAKIKAKIHHGHFRLMPFQESRNYFFSVYDAVVIEILTNN